MIKVKVPLVEMAVHLSDLKNHLMGVTVPIIKHVIKLVIYKEYRLDDVNNWKGEICGFLDEVPKLKSTKRLPSSEQIYKNSWLAGKMFLLKE